jgi:hypothetical protein
LPIVTGNRDGEAESRKVRWAVVSLWDLDKSKDVVEAALQKFAEVESLTLLNESPVDLDLSFLSSFQSESPRHSSTDFHLICLASMTDLSSLHISWYFTWENALSSTLSNLQSLSIYNATPRLTSSLLSPSLVPNLRALALVCSGDDETLRDSGLTQLLPQLESISIDMEWIMEPGVEFLRSKADSIIVDLFAPEPGFDQLFEPELSVKHIRLCHLFLDDPSSDREENLDYLGEFTTCLKENPTAPVRSINVDSSLLLVLETPTQGRITVERFQALCKDRKVDVIYETLPRNIDIDSSVSSEFWARQRQLKGTLRE